MSIQNKKKEDDMKKTALLSVSDKTGIVDFARELSAMGYDIISTGGTAQAIRDGGVPCTDVSEYTGAPEILDGRVKTLQYPIYGGILADRGKAAHMDQLVAQKIRTIDIVACNLYPFEEVSRKIPRIENEGINPEVIENIDIGGPTMLRAAAKNYKNVVAVVDPADYAAVLEGIKAGGVSDKLKSDLMAKIFSHTAHYDAMIANYVGDEKFPQLKTVPMRMVDDAEIRYGENPHQNAALYVNSIDPNASAAMNARLIQGKKMSYNNYLDLDAAWKFVHEYPSKPNESMCTIIKHNNTCGAAIGKTLVDAYRKSYACDALSAFGGIIAFNQPVDAETAEDMVVRNRHFVECVVAPGFSKEALGIFATKKDVRILEQAEPYVIPKGVVYKAIEGGILVQDKNTQLYDAVTVATERVPTQDERNALDFAMRACKLTKSNAIILARGLQVVGVGTGQQSRIDSLDIAIRRMKKMPLDGPGAPDKTKPLVMASDAFFPFPDCIELFASYDGSAVIWPGGSVNDQASIDMANETNMAMMKTRMRHFTH